MKNRLDNEIATNIIKWFQDNKRLLPWRETDNPYYILVSEVMLQQTQVTTVIPYYLRFIERLPKLCDLARASDDTLHDLWEGLGYYSRVMRLRTFAVEIIEGYGGHIPSDPQELIKLPGIGPYTCGALASFAYGVKIPAVDGNVARLVARLANDDKDILKQSTTKLYTQWLEQIIPDNIYDFNQGLIELGALVCKPKNPSCEVCPLIEQCQARKAGNELHLPNKKKKVKQKAYKTPVFILREMGQVMFVFREEKGLLHNMWGLPIVENKEEPEDYMTELGGLISSWFDLEINDYVVTCKELGQTKHVFSHRIWNQQVYEIEVKGLKDALSLVESPLVKWDQPDLVKLPSAFKRSLELLGPVKNI